MEQKLCKDLLSLQADLRVLLIGLLATFLYSPEST